MAAYLHLKSKVIKEADPFRADLSRFRIPLTPDPVLYERDLTNFRRRFSTTEDAQEIALQDMVTLTCSSPNPRFCKEHITIRAGLGLFSKELEGRLMGWKAGQSGTVSVKGEPVSVTVERIRRERLPEVDDALAARCGIPGINTAADIESYCKGKQFDDVLEGPADDAFTYLNRWVIDNSEFELDFEELEYSHQMAQEMFDRSPLAAQADSDEAEAPAEEGDMDPAWSDPEFLKNLARQSAEYSLKSAALGMAALERRGKAPTDGDYKRYLRRFTDMGVSEQEARGKHPPLYFLLEQVAGWYMDELEALALQRLKEGIA